MPDTERMLFSCASIKYSVGPDIDQARGNIERRGQRRRVDTCLASGPDHGDDDTRGGNLPDDIVVVCDQERNPPDRWAIPPGLLNSAAEPLPSA